ncbi:MAG: hypothetical protein ACKVKF_06240 [Rhodobacterales bacterium]
MPRIKRRYIRTPMQKEVALRNGFLATLLFDLCDREIQPSGYRGSLRRSEMVSLDVHKDDRLVGGVMLTLNAEIGLGSPDQTRPMNALQHWFRCVMIDFSPIFMPRPYAVNSVY